MPLGTSWGTLYPTFFPPELETRIPSGCWPTDDLSQTLMSMCLNLNPLTFLYTVPASHITILGSAFTVYTAVFPPITGPTLSLPGSLPLLVPVLSPLPGLVDSTSTVSLQSFILCYLCSSNGLNHFSLGHHFCLEFPHIAAGNQPYQGILKTSPGIPIAFRRQSKFLGVHQAPAFRGSPSLLFILTSTLTKYTHMRLGSIS